MDPGGAALVTGASRGIGRAVALELARRGFDVVAAMRHPGDGAGLAGELGRARGTIRAAPLDVTEPASIHIPDGLRVLVNNAAIEREYLPLEHTPEEDWRAVFETNVFGLVEVTRRAIPELRRGGGVICNLTSSSLLVPVPFYAVYRASKAAVAAIGETLSAELAPFGIRVVEILPGPIATDMLAASNRLPEAARYPGYDALAQQMYDGRQAVEEMITQPEAAARAIGAAILDEAGALRRGCDPLGQRLLDAWSANPMPVGPPS
jgi:NAD(P)-dependent dehydrogenase (short-subunit alcohol dehydrogenase family)